MSSPCQGEGFFRPFGRGGLDTSDGWCIAPPIFSFSSRRKRENGPCTVQKRKRSIAPAGGRRTGDAQGVLPFFTNVSSPRRSLSGGFGGCRKACPSLFAAADAPINGPVGADLCVRPPPGFHLSLLGPAQQIIGRHSKEIGQLQQIGNLRIMCCGFIILIGPQTALQIVCHLCLSLFLLFSQSFEPLCKSLHNFPLTGNLVAYIIICN